MIEDEEFDGLVKEVFDRAEIRERICTGVRHELRMGKRRALWRKRAVIAAFSFGAPLALSCLMFAICSVCRTYTIPYPLVVFSLAATVCFFVVVVEAFAGKKLFSL